MTWDEVEKAMQFLLDNQARNEAQIGMLSTQIDGLGRRVDQLTGDVAELGGHVRQLTDLVGRVAESTRVFVERANGRFERVETALADMTEKLNGLIGIVEQHVTDESRHGKGSR